VVALLVRHGRGTPARSADQRPTDGQPIAMVTAQDVHWLIAHPQAVVAASSAV
jgi:hypothetical protein